MVGCAISASDNIVLMMASEKSTEHVVGGSLFFKDKE